MERELAEIVRQIQPDWPDVDVAPHRRLELVGDGRAARMEPR
jgi:hypothetical protein